MSSESDSEIQPLLSSSSNHPPTENPVHVNACADEYTERDSDSPHGSSDHCHTATDTNNYQRNNSHTATVTSNQRDDSHTVTVIHNQRDSSQTGGSVTSSLQVWVLALACVVCFVVVRVVLPVYSDSTCKAGGDVFTVLLYINLWFPFVLAALTILYKALWDRATTLLPAVRWRVLWLMGALTLLNGFCSTFASLPSRTPPYLQGLLMTMRIPFTVLMRLAILRKGISLRRLGCTVAVLIGVFITVEPQIWSLPGSTGSGTSPSPSGSSGARIVWPLIFAMGFLPAATSAVLCEREFRQGQAQSLSFITWSLFFQLLTMIPLFWVDLIPFFGMAKSLEEFSHRLHRGLACNFSSSEDCYGLSYKGWVFILAFCLGNLLQFLLIQRAEGAVFAVLVQALVTPAATLFWTFFKLEDDDDVVKHHDLALIFDPRFTMTTCFTVGGLAVIVPAVVLYNVFSRWDDNAAD